MSVNDIQITYLSAHPSATGHHRIVKKNRHRTPLPARDEPEHGMDYKDQEEHGSDYQFRSTMIIPEYVEYEESAEGMILPEYEEYEEYEGMYRYSQVPQPTCFRPNPGRDAV